MFISLRNSLSMLWAKYRTSKILWGIVVIIAVILVIILKGGSKTVSVDTAVVTKSDIIDAVSLSGRTQSASAVELGFADQGRVASVLVNEGQKVSKGQVLARLETSDLQANLSNAQALLTIAKAGVGTNTTNLEKVTTQQNALVENAYRTLLSNGLEAIPSDINTAGPNAPKITGAYEGPEGDYIIHFYPSSANSGVSFDIKGLEYGFSNPATQNSNISLGSRGLYIQFGSSTQGYANTDWIVSIPNKRSSSYAMNLNAYQSALTTRDQVISLAQADLVKGNTVDSIANAKIQQAQSSVDSIISQITRRTIIAPFSGVIANNNLKPGQSTASVASTGTASSSNTIKVISENDYEVILKVPEISISKIRVGQEVIITLDAYGKDVVFPATVTEINPAETVIDGVPVYETKVAFSKNDERVRSGMTATATITANRRNNVLSLPISLVHTDASGSYVYILNKDGKTSKKVVTLGLRGSDSKVEIVEGLSEGETVKTLEVK